MCHLSFCQYVSYNSLVRHLYFHSKMYYPRLAFNNEDANNSTFQYPCCLGHVRHPGFFYNAAFRITRLFSPSDENERRRTQFCVQWKKLALWNWPTKIQSTTTLFRLKKKTDKFFLNIHSFCRLSSDRSITSFKVSSPQWDLVLPLSNSSTFSFP